jgi:hypothetical protein
VAGAAVDVSVKAADIAARKARNAKKDGMDGMMAPYKNVVRMHLLIFFFAFAQLRKGGRTSGSTPWCTRCIFSRGGC